jgi:hypothetical protein
VQTPAALLVFPSFIPTRDTDRHQAAAIHGGDFFFTGVGDGSPQRRFTLH